MVNVRWHARILAAFVLLLSLVSQQSFAQAKLARFDKDAVLKNLDDEDLLKVRLRQQRPTAQGTLEQLGRCTVDLGDGETATLGAIAGQVFANQHQFKLEVRQAPRGVLFGDPEDVEVAYESPDAYLITRGLRVTVTDPASLSTASPAFRSFLGNRERVTLDKLTPESRTGLGAFMKNEAKLLPSGHPLKEAATQGEEALLQAICDGKGTFEVVDTVLVPRTPLALVNGRLALPTLRDGAFDLGRLQPTELPSLNNILRPVNERALLQLPPAQHTSFEEGGHYQYRTSFLAGFTRGSAWEWERRWNYPSGFFRVTLGGGYGVGLRIPIEVSGQVSPTGIAVSDTRDDASTAQNNVQVRVFDANPSFYRSAGLADDQIFDGREAVLEAHVGFGFKFRALWTDVAHMRYREIGFNYSQNVAPPFAGSGGMRLAIPSSVTRTELDLGAIKGYAQAALSLNGASQVRMDHEGRVDGESVETRTMVFRDAAPQTVGIRIPALRESGTQQFGFRLSNPSYRIDLTMTPEVRLGLRVGYGSFSRRFNTDWIALNAARVRLGSVSFGRHAGTRSEFSWNGGQKQFTKLEGRVAREEIRGALRIRSAHSNRYVVLDRGPDALLKAGGERQADGDIFDIRALDNNQVALRSRRTGKWVRAGLSQECWLGASSEQISDWEKFELVPLTGNRFAIRCIRNGKYVRAGLGRESQLGALTNHRDVWETFERVEVQ